MQAHHDGGLIHFFYQHQVIVTLVAYYVGSAFVSSLPAPTGTSSLYYQFIFKFANTLGANLARAYSSKIEQSPNFLPAIDLHNAQNPKVSTLNVVVKSDSGEAAQSPDTKVSQ